MVISGQQIMASSRCIEIEMLVYVIAPVLDTKYSSLIFGDW
jgi:hypothetical protein